MPRTGKKYKSKRRKIRVFLFIILLIFSAFWYYQNSNKVTESSNNIDIEKLAIPAHSVSDIIVEHTGYTLCYSEDDEQPYWVAYVLTADEVNNASISRDDNFRPDPSIPTKSAQLSDYKGSGYDRGHMIPAADLRWSEDAMNDSFYLSNMSPQVGAFNRGIWAKLEDQVRVFANENKAICVVTGPVLSDGPFKTIGKSKVSVPNFYYKVILDYTEPQKKAIGFILPNAGSSKPLSYFAVSVDEVEEITGFDFFNLLEDKEENTLESSFDLRQWNLI